MLEAMTGKRVFVVPWLYELGLPEEDGCDVERKLRATAAAFAAARGGGEGERRGGGDRARAVVVVVAPPHVAITADLLPVERDARCRVEWWRDAPPLDARAWFNDGAHAGLYSAFDEDGLPTRDAAGAELSKKARKRLARKYERYLGIAPGRLPSRPGEVDP